MITDKYTFDFPQETIIAEIKRLTNQGWKLIPMRENEENWQRQLITVIIEVTGLKEIFLSDSHLLQLLAKLEGLQKLGEELSFEDYRRTVFECTTLVQGFLKHDR